MRSSSLILVALLGCRAELVGGGDTAVDAAPPLTDAPRFGADGGPDAAPPADARPCTGGDASGVAPDGSCFVHVFTPRSYADAAVACAAMGGGLARLKDASTDAFAQTFVGTRDTWIGLADTATEMTFVWDDGTPLVYSNWHVGEPNDGDDTYDEDCAIIAGARIDKQWDDRPCAPLAQFPGSGVYGYLCQY
jgi:KRAB domain-containing zinc finger protein